MTYQFRLEIDGFQRKASKLREIKKESFAELDFEDR
jgi:hypothetical protein